MNKGFTLIEVLSVLIIIAILFSISLVAIFPHIEDSKKIVNDAQVKTILDAAYDYTLKNLEILPSNGGTNFVTLGELKSEGLIDTNIINTKTGESYSDATRIQIKDEGNCESNSDCKKEGNYSYTIMEDNNSSNVEIIIGNNINSDTVDLSINEDYITPSISSVKYNNSIVQTYDQLTIISKNKQIVSKVDRKVPGVYNISYTVKFIYGGQEIVGNKILNVVVSDKTPPSIVPSSFEMETISANTTTFDLMRGVSCTDNSNSCKIFVDGVVKFGIPATYTIRYTAKDSVGNVSDPVIRLIKVE